MMWLMLLSSRGYMTSSRQPMYVTCDICPCFLSCTIDPVALLQVSVESGFRPDLLEALVSRGHNISIFDVNLGIAEVQAVTMVGDKFAGQSPLALCGCAPWD